MIERNAGLPPERRIEFRVGIHLGDVFEESDGDLMGDSVNIAARSKLPPSLGHYEIDLAIRLQRRQGFNAVAREQEGDRSASYFVAELLQDESLDIRLVVNDQDVRCHAVRSTRVSISLRSITKSMGLVRSASAPPSSALRFVSASP